MVFYFITSKPISWYYLKFVDMRVLIAVIYNSRLSVVWSCEICPMLSLWITLHLCLSGQMTVWGLTVIVFRFILLEPTLAYDLCKIVVFARHAHYQPGNTPLALVWKDENCSQYVIDTDSKGQVPSHQQVFFITYLTYFPLQLRYIYCDWLSHTDTPSLSLSFHMIR